MAGSHCLENSKNGHILAKNGPTLMKFDRMTQIWSLAYQWLKFKIFKIQDGGGGQFDKQLNRDIFTTV